MLVLLCIILFKFILGIISFTIFYNVLIVIFKYRVVKFAWRNSKVFFVPIVPFVGSIFVMFVKGLRLEILTPLLWMEEHFGCPFNFWLGSDYYYCTSDPSEALSILANPKCINKAPVYDCINYIFSNSLLTAPGEEWKPRRRYLRPAYKAPTLKSFYYTYNRLAEKLLLDLTTINTGAGDDIAKILRLHSFRCFFCTSAGFFGNEIDLQLERVALEVDSIQQDFGTVMFNPVKLLINWIRNPMQNNLINRVQNLKTAFKNIYLEIIQERSTKSDFKDSSILLELLFSEGYKKILKVDDKNEDMMVFTVGATETSGEVMAFALVLLGMHPDIQETLYNEIIAEIGDRSIEFEDLSRLKYTEAVINEALRLFPPGPVIARKVTEDVTIGEKIIPKGVNVAVFVFDIHRNPKYWSNPLTFNPTRFLPENLPNIVNGSFLPFSFGLRDCPGKISSLIIMKNVIANVVRSFKVTSKHKSLDEFDIGSVLTMHVLTPLDCSFIPRN